MCFWMGQFSKTFSENFQLAHDPNDNDKGNEGKPSRVQAMTKQLSCMHVLLQAQPMIS